MMWFLQEKMLMIKTYEASNALHLPAILFKGGDTNITVTCYYYHKGEIVMKRFNKLIGYLSVFMFAAVFPLSAHAEKAGTTGAGEWDKLGTYTYTYSSPTVYSSGGDFRVCLSGSTPFSVSLHLYEDDPGDNPDEYVGSNYFSPGECHTFSSIGKFVDGSNNKAEFFVTDYSGKSKTVTFYD